MKRRKAAKPLSPSVDDEWCDMVREECAKAIVNWMRGSINVMRPIKSLSLDEMRGMAEACTARYVVLLSRREIEQEPDPPADDLFFLL